MNFPEVTAILTDLQKRDIISRIWQKDHTVWNASPKEISNRLGWLDATSQMRREVPALKSFADEIRQAGFQKVVLLGMGGASLGAEVLRQSFGSAPDYPELIVLDSTMPERVGAVTREIDPARTLFIVASKSGGTIETLSLYKYFSRLARRQNFVAITDPGTSLARLAEEAGFWRVFLNSPDIGGRYSVLSYFGLVPAALIGLDITILLQKADTMRIACAAKLPQNPATQLGATMGALAQQGRDKLTLITSPAISSFVLWLEQLIAESTGKNGRGIVPVVGEPLVEPTYYGDDRLFVYLRLEGDDNSVTDKAFDRLKSSGHLIIKQDMKDCYDLGAEFFRWEFATAVAGAVLGVNPFDQPNVQSAKDATDRVLREYRTSGRLPRTESTLSLKDLLQEAEPGKYVAIMAYVQQTPEMDAALAQIRQIIMKRYQIATTSGYGPRLLHSIGQLHKGGPDEGLFLQVTADHREDIPVHGESYTFGVLVDAQALGDFQALQSLGRKVCRLHLGGDRPLKKLLGEV